MISRAAGFGNKGIPLTSLIFLKSVKSSLQGFVFVMPCENYLTLKEYLIGLAPTLIVGLNILVLTPEPENTAPIRTSCRSVRGTI